MLRRCLAAKDFISSIFFYMDFIVGRMRYFVTNFFLIECSLRHIENTNEQCTKLLFQQLGFNHIFSRSTSLFVTIRVDVISTHAGILVMMNKLTNLLFMGTRCKRINLCTNDEYGIIAIAYI